MFSIITSCPACGHTLEPAPGTICSHCQTLLPVPAEALSSASNPETSSSPWLDMFWAFLIWGISGAFLLGLDAALRLALWLMHKPIPQVEITRGLAILSLILTFVMQLAAMAGSWMYVTRFGKKPFLRTLGWRWHTQFRWVHAVALAALMYGVAILLSKLLPHRETELEKVLKLGLSVRVMVVVLAVLAAPIVEEVVYRGVLYSAAERLGGKAFGVGLATFIFALVHVPQYWGSVAAITVIVTLSFILTLLRAWTESLLPCVAMHFVYNGVQAAFLLIAPDKALESAPKETALAVITVISRWCGLN